nr:hypothetical protein [Bacillus sp. UMB0893]
MVPIKVKFRYKRKISFWDGFLSCEKVLTSRIYPEHDTIDVKYFVIICAVILKIATRTKKLSGVLQKMIGTHGMSTQMQRLSVS